MDEKFPTDGRRRVVIENFRPRGAEASQPIKRIIHDPLTIEVDVFADGHDLLVSRLKYRHDDRQPWRETVLHAKGNDLWTTDVAIDRLGRWQFAVVAWVDHFATWRYELTKRAAAGQDLAVDLLIGANLIEPAAERAKYQRQEEDARLLKFAAERLRADSPQHERVETALSGNLEQAMLRHADRTLATESAVYEIDVERPRARFSSWYELFPRSCGQDGKHGTLRDVIGRLGYVAEMGFDILYMPPIHPVGTSFRKGKNNKPDAQPDDVGSPWGIGNVEGGHDGIHPELGTIEDFRALRIAAEKHGIELALDLAFQCAPEHPYVKAHPQWFKARPDGTIQYAENPPKKYQDIYPFDFETADWKALWIELKRVVDFWINEGVRVFRVDNPHTKAFPFWQWLIRDVRRRAPDVLFLSEAFTRPKVRYRLGKLGYSSSYTYFTWRTTKQELTEYFTELTTPPVNQIFRANLWPNTPDILHAFLQTGGKPPFLIRSALAATCGANWGIYGPGYELCDGTPREPGSEEYLDSEKYQTRAWDIDSPESIKPWIAALNRIRREHEALQRDDTLRFHDVDNEHLLAYTKHSPDGRDVILTVINLDPFAAHDGMLKLKPELLPRGLPPSYEVRDLLTGKSYAWEGLGSWISLDPAHPAHVFQLP